MRFAQRGLHAMNMEAFAALWPRVAYWVLWASILAILATGMILLAVGQTVEWIPNAGNPNVYQAQTVSLAPAGGALSGIGGLAVIATLMLEAFVGPLHRRRSQH